MDKSALVRIGASPDAGEWAARMQRGLVRITTVTPRAPSVPDLLVAAVAELTRAVVLHVDKVFDLIASITGQPVERVRTP